MDGGQPGGFRPDDGLTPYGDPPTDLDVAKEPRIRNRACVRGEGGPPRRAGGGGHPGEGEGGCAPGGVGVKDRGASREIFET